MSKFKREKKRLLQRGQAGVVTAFHMAGKVAVPKWGRFEGHGFMGITPLKVDDGELQLDEFPLCDETEIHGRMGFHTSGVEVFVLGKVHGGIHDGRAIAITLDEWIDAFIHSPIDGVQTEHGHPSSGAH